MSGERRSVPGLDRDDPRYLAAVRSTVDAAGTPDGATIALLRAVLTGTEPTRARQAPTEETAA